VNRKRNGNPSQKVVVAIAAIVLTGCASGDVFSDSNMDFASLRSVAVMPFTNLSSSEFAAARVRDVFSNMLLATGAVYVLPPGEVARGLLAIGRLPPEGPSSDQIKQLAAVLKVDAVITGVVSEYGPIRSGAATANVISVSVKMIEKSSGLVVWSASSTRGGISVMDRLFGGGGEPMNTITEKAVNELMDKLFQ
jgi:hypothetical protein